MWGKGHPDWSITTEHQSMTTIKIFQRLKIASVFWFGISLPTIAIACTFDSRVSVDNFWQVFSGTLLTDVYLLAFGAVLVLFCADLFFNRKI